MTPRSIGIIGGAGPMAGYYLLSRIFSLFTQEYGCYKDDDYPKVVLISFPFSEMLTPTLNPIQIKQELKSCLSELRRLDTSLIAIACNTLHLFLEEEGIVHLPRLIGEVLSSCEPPLVLATSTSVRFGLHKNYFRCDYPSEETQYEVDQIIEQILKGRDEDLILKTLQSIIEKQTQNTIVLGCTELSLYSSKLKVEGKKIIDPLEILARELVEQSLNKGKVYGNIR